MTVRHHCASCTTIPSSVPTSSVVCWALAVTLTLKVSIQSVPMTVWHHQAPPYNVWLQLILQLGQYHPDPPHMFTHQTYIQHSEVVFKFYWLFSFFLEIVVKLTWMLWSKSQASMQFYLHIIHLFTKRNKMICWKVMHSICHKQTQKWSLENGKYNVTYMAYCDKANGSLF